MKIHPILTNHNIKIFSNISEKITNHLDDRNKLINASIGENYICV